jgi:hypothetical protein
MLDILRRRRNASELNKLEVCFQQPFNDLVAVMEKHGRPRLQDTYRDGAAQNRKLAQGLSTVGAGDSPHNFSVTRLDGTVIPASFATHFLHDDAPLNPPNTWMARLAIEAHKLGLTTGLTWARNANGATAPGKPLRIAMEAAIAAEDYDRLVELLKQGNGFDPLHVEYRSWKQHIKETK